MTASIVGMIQDLGVEVELTPQGCTCFIVPTGGHWSEQVISEPDKTTVGTVYDRRRISKRYNITANKTEHYWMDSLGLQWTVWCPHKWYKMLLGDLATTPGFHQLLQNNNPCCVLTSTLASLDCHSKQNTPLSLVSKCHQTFWRGQQIDAARIQHDTGQSHLIHSMMQQLRSCLC